MEGKLKAYQTQIQLMAADVKRASVRAAHGTPISRPCVLRPLAGTGRVSLACCLASALMLLLPSGVWDCAGLPRCQGGVLGRG